MTPLPDLSTLSAHLSPFLPATVIAAVLLFIVRELLENRRRNASERRASTALKYVFATACERNLWTISTLKRALEDADQTFGANPPLTFKTYQVPSGDHHWKTCYADGQLKSGGALPTAKRATFDASILRVAELNESLFVSVESAVEGVSELEHIRGSLINFSNSDDPFDQTHFEGFPEWALEQLPDIQASLNQLYLVCTGRQLEKPRLR